MRWLCISLIRLYRKFISPLKPPCCRFSPTCSAYAIEAFTKRGFFAGMILTVGRICRCNAFCRPGYDPVPDRGFKRIPIECRKGRDDTVQNAAQGASQGSDMPSPTQNEV